MYSVTPFGLPDDIAFVLVSGNNKKFLLGTDKSICGRL
jgi:hypothetical protein